MPQDAEADARRCFAAWIRARRARVTRCLQEHEVGEDEIKRGTDREQHRPDHLPVNSCPLLAQSVLVRSAALRSSDPIGGGGAISHEIPGNRNATLKPARHKAAER